LGSRIRRQPPFAKQKYDANYHADGYSESTALSRVSGATQKNGDSSSKEKYNEADAPDASDRRDLDDRKTVHLGVGKIAEGAVRRTNRDQVFAGHPVKWESKRGPKWLSPTQKAAGAQNSEPEKDGWDEKRESNQQWSEFKRACEVNPLVQCSDHPRDGGEKKRSAATKLPRDG